MSFSNEWCYWTRLGWLRVVLVSCWVIYFFLFPWGTFDRIFMFLVLCCLKGWVLIETAWVLSWLIRICFWYLEVLGSLFWNNFSSVIIVQLLIAICLARGRLNFAIFPVFRWWLVWCLDEDDHFSIWVWWFSSIDLLWSVLQLVLIVLIFYDAPV